jgi:cytochrome o ubiquinol oxidase subunit 2
MPRTVGACGTPQGIREWWRPWRSGRYLAACVGVPLAGCQQAGVLDPQGPIASAERLLMINATAIMLVVVVPVILATLGFAWW